MDADLQDDPAEIPRFLDALAAGPDLVSGWARSPGSALEAASVPAVQPDHLDGVRREAAGPQLRLQGGPPRDLHAVPSASSTGTSRRWRTAWATRSPRWRSTTGPLPRSLEVRRRTVPGGLLDLFTVLVITRYGRRPGHFFGGIGIVAALVGFLILTYLTGVWVFTDDPIGNRPSLTSGCCWRWWRCSSWPWGSSPS